MWLVNLLLLFKLTVHINGSIVISKNESITPSFSQLTNLTSDLILKIFFNGRIIGGATAEENQFSYQVAIVKSVGNMISLCGGSLIKPNFILTSAHCVDKASSLYIIAGTNNLLTGQGKQVRYIYNPKREIIIHPMWNSKSKKNDIALICLEKLLVNINIIALPEENRDIDEQILTVSGWGSTEERGSGISIKLQYANVILVTANNCKLKWGFYMDDSKICATSRICLGDTGGPLTLNRPLTVVGIISFRSIQCNSDAPDVFTKVTYFLPWIKKHIGHDDDDDDYYD